MATTGRLLSSGSRLLANIKHLEAVRTGLPCLATQQRLNVNTSSKTSISAAPKAQYGGRYTVTMLTGDGVGPEMLGHVREVFRYAGAPVDFEQVTLNHSTSDEEYDNAMLSVKRNGIALKGNIYNQIDEPGFRSRNIEIRSELELSTNVVRCKSIPGVPSKHENIDIVVIRENTEGEYANLEHASVDGIVESLKIITEAKSTAVAEFAFRYAVKHGRKKVTAVHKANIMKLADGLFLDCCTKVSEKYPEIEFEGMIVDNCSMQMVSRPQQFDVMVLPNLYGNIVANIGSGLIGGPGLTSGVNLGHNIAVFESGTRNTGKHVAGKNIANPAGMLLAGADMLAYLGLNEKADLIYNTVYDVLGEDQIHTPDLGGTNTTTDVVQGVIARLKAANKWY